MTTWDMIRRAASGNPGTADWDQAVQSLGEHGFRGMHQVEGRPGLHMPLETGHRLWVYHKGAGHPPRDQGFHAIVWYPRDDDSDQGAVYGRLGEDPNQVGPGVRSLLGDRDVLHHMRGQMSGEGWGPSFGADMTRGH